MFQIFHWFAGKIFLYFYGLYKQCWLLFRSLQKDFFLVSIQTPLFNLFRVQNVERELWKFRKCKIALSLEYHSVLFYILFCCFVNKNKINLRLCRIYATTNKAGMVVYQLFILPAVAGKRKYINLERNISSICTLITFNDISWLMPWLNKSEVW